jgi:type IX secretion system PorP/SprF family membrane protein
MRNHVPYYLLVKAIFASLLIMHVSGQNVLAQQRVQFTQYMFNGLVLNPAYAGADEALSLTFIQRKQWAKIEGSPSTQSLSAHSLFRKKQLGLGGMLINDRIGVHRNVSAMTAAAYHLKVGQLSYLSMGLQAGIHSRKSDYASLVGNANVDPKLYDASVSYTAFDLGMGLYFRSPRLHVGLSAPELLPESFSLNDTSTIRLNNVNFFLFSKYRITVNENIDVEPSVLLKYLKGIPLSYDINFNLIYKKVLTLGLSYRKSESVDFMLKGQISPQLQFGYSYDFAIGEVSRVSNGSHELMINYIFRYTQAKVISPRQ